MSFMFIQGFHIHVALQEYIYIVHWFNWFIYIKEKRKRSVLWFQFVMFLRYIGPPRSNNYLGTLSYVWFPDYISIQLPQFWFIIFRLLLFSIYSWKVYWMLLGAYIGRSMPFLMFEYIMVWMFAFLQITIELFSVNSIGVSSFIGYIYI